MSQPEPAGKDPRPLPEGWITEYSPQWSAWYYVNTKDANPQAIWQHPLDQPGAAAPSNEPTNPDKRPLPDGWISRYNQEHKTFFYVNTKAPDPGSTVTWTHPAESQPPPTNVQSPATADVVHAPHTGDPVHAQSPASTNPPVGAAGAPPTPDGTKQNPDTRPLPPGWITDYDENFKAWYYVNTHDPNPAATWAHPAETHPGATGATGATATPGAATSPTVPTSTTATTAPVTSDHNPAATAPGSTPADPTKENPDKRPLPTGWVGKYDENYKTWYYVDTTKPGGPSSWVHPAESNPPAATTTPGVTSPASPHPDPSQPHQQQGYGAPTPGQGGHGEAGKGQGLEGLLGQSAGKLVGGLFGGKGRAQMDSFANQIGSQVNKYKGSHGSGGGHGQPYGVPPGGNPGYGPPGQTPGQTPGQYGPPPGGQGYPGQGQQGQQGHPGYGPPPNQTPGGYPGQPGYGPPPGGQPYGTPSGQGGHGSGGGFGNLPGDLGKLAGKFGFKK